MGASNDLKDENKDLHNKKEELERQKGEIKKKLEDSQIFYTPQQIQKFKEDNSKLKNQFNNLSKQYNNLDLLCKNIEKENNQIKAYCGQLQLLLLTKMQGNSYNQNASTFNSFQTQANTYQSQLNSLINSQNSNNKIQNNNNFINNNQKIITIIFNIENMRKYPIVSLPEYRLGNVFLLFANQIGNPDYLNINKFKFYYGTINITDKFINNNEVRSLNFGVDCPIITVYKKN